MALKSDKWIRKMALEHGMIVPFEDTAVEGSICFDTPTESSARLFGTKDAPSSYDIEA